MPTVDNELNEILLEGNNYNGVDEYSFEDSYDDYSGSNELQFEAEDYEFQEEDELFEGEYDEFNEFTEDELEFITDIGNVISAEDETELALELESISTEAEFEEFLGKIFKKVAKKVKKYGRKAIPKVKKFINGPGRKLLARALPLVGTAVGSALAPGIGTQIGGAAGNIFGSLLSGGGAPGTPTPPIPGMPGGTAGGNPLSALLGGGNPLGALLGGAGGGNPLAALLGGAGGGNPLASLLGSGLGGNLLGKFLGGEMEHRSLDEAKHDAAKRIIRTIAQSTAQVATRPVSSKSALKRAIKQNIPRALRPALVQVPAAGQTPGALTNQAVGQWVRQGNNIILMGA